MDTPQPSLEQQMMQQRLKDFLPAFDQLQKEKGVIVVPVIRQGEFGELIPDFYFMSREEADKRIQAKQPPQGDSTHASNV